MKNLTLASLIALCALPGLSSAQGPATLSQQIVLEPGWNVVNLKVDAPQDQLERLLREGGVSEIVARTAGARAVTTSDHGSTPRVPDLPDDDWSADERLWTSRMVDPSDDADLTSAAAALSAGRCYILRSSIDRPRVETELSGAPVFRRQVWARDGGRAVRRARGRRRAAERPGVLCAFAGAGRGHPGPGRASSGGPSSLPSGRPVGGVSF